MKGAVNLYAGNSFSHRLCAYKQVITPYINIKDRRIFHNGNRSNRSAHSQPPSGGRSAFQCDVGPKRQRRGTPPPDPEAVRSRIHKIYYCTYKYPPGRPGQIAPDSFAEFAAAAARLAVILNCYLVAGAFDYLLKIRVRDIIGFNTLHSETLIAPPEVRQTRAFFVMTEIIDGAPLDF